MSQAALLVRDIEATPPALNRAARLTTLGDRPRSVVTAATGSRAEWAAQQDDLARLSTTSAHRTVRARHAPHSSRTRPDAADSGRAIADIVTAVKARS
ncbi:hypothetical protein [Solirubrobacter deserti]|uniref:Uncharacterized protein n=1 Tax=Solirubrobacter deserti TaxID=2282478 RepID=A0ABT4RP72_9ACTN|nr:hypothetical protein [Solirubrobacter deserti]MDA0140370.1 hypothetical protein [Solirubrobacter deserti]